MHKHGNKNACQIYSVTYVSKMKSILLNAFYVIYGAVCFQITHFSYYEFEYLYITLQ